MFVAALIAAFGDRIWLRPPLGRFDGSFDGNSEAGKALNATSGERAMRVFRSASSASSSSDVLPPSIEPQAVKLSNQLGRAILVERIEIHSAPRST
jgi:hypothetical protein